MEVIRLSRAGDQDAFAALYDQHKNMVFKTAFLILRERAEAEDALQEVFAKVAGALASYDPRRGAFTTWLYRITVNECLNRRRRARPVRLDPRDSPPTPEAQVAADEEMEQALAGLSDKLRAVIVLRYYAGLPYDQIAETLDVPVGTVKSRINQAIQTLRAFMVKPAPARAQAAANGGEVAP
jgi:RNA polymerase sigma-70 factor, ECF subfamily